MPRQYVVLEGGDLHPCYIRTVYGPFDSEEAAQAFVEKRKQPWLEDTEIVLLGVPREDR
jgi:hypothetical protein